MFQILVIDDDLVTRVLLQKTLQKQGYKVAIAADGEEGMVIAMELHPALIISDWMMPKLTGLEVCRQVKADADLSGSYFILLTTRDATEDRVKGLDTGADDFLAKPIELDELRARVRAGLRIYQLNHDLQAQNQALEQLTSDLQTQKGLLEAELIEAAEYVRSLLPSPLTGQVTIESRFVPSKQLGGDCFDYFWLDPQYLVIYLLDVSGHGVGATLPSITVLNLLRTQSLPGANFYQPAQVLRALNEIFQMDSQGDKYFTIWYGVYTPHNRQLLYACAGHPPAVLLSHSPTGQTQVRQLKTASLPIGMLPDVHFISDRCEVEPGSTLYVFSDGIYEILQPDGTIWGLKAFIELLCKISETSPNDLDEILRHIYLLNQKDSLEDDLSLLQIVFS